MGKIADSLRPLGIFGPSRERSFDLAPEQLNSHRDALDEKTRRLVSDYLLSGTVIIALMEHTFDVLGGEFGVSGGSGVLSDGVYYWRRDAAEYVAHYGIDVGSDAIEHMRAHGWVAPELNEATVSEIDEYLFRTIRGS